MPRKRKYVPSIRSDEENDAEPETAPEDVDTHPDCRECPPYGWRSMCYCDECKACAYTFYVGVSTSEPGKGKQSLWTGILCRECVHKKHAEIQASCQTLWYHDCGIYQRPHTMAAVDAVTVGTQTEPAVNRSGGSGWGCFRCESTLGVYSCSRCGVTQCSTHNTIEWQPFGPDTHRYLCRACRKTEATRVFREQEEAQRARRDV